MANQRDIVSAPAAEQVSNKLATTTSGAESDYLLATISEASSPTRSNKSICELCRAQQSSPAAPPKTQLIHFWPPQLQARHELLAAQNKTIRRRRCESQTRRPAGRPPVSQRVGRKRVGQSQSGARLSRRADQLWPARRFALLCAPRQRDRRQPVSDAETMTLADLVRPFNSTCAIRKASPFY